jgi:hypothetical protein
VKGIYKNLSRTYVSRETLICFHSFIHSFITWSVLRQAHRLFKSKFSTECDLVLSLSISSSLSFLYNHSVAAYMFFFVFPALILPSTFPSITCFRRQFLRKCDQSSVPSFYVPCVGYSTPYWLPAVLAFPTRSVQLTFSHLREHTFQQIHTDNVTTVYRTR